MEYIVCNVSWVESTNHSTYFTLYSCPPNIMPSLTWLGMPVLYIQFLWQHMQFVAERRKCVVTFFSIIIIIIILWFNFFGYSNSYYGEVVIWLSNYCHPKFHDHPQPYTRPMTWTVEIPCHVGIQNQTSLHQCSSAPQHTHMCLWLGSASIL